MKTGDLVRQSIITTRYNRYQRFGIVVETGKFTGNKDVKVMWPDIGIATENSEMMEVVVGDETGGSRDSFV